MNLNHNNFYPRHIADKKVEFFLCAEDRVCVVIYDGDRRNTKRLNMMIVFDEGLEDVAPKPEP